MKTLAICIPTYRRPAFLQRCVNSAVKSAGACSIKIFVADDSVSNVNDTVATQLQAEYPFLTWHRNEVNLGLDANIQQAVQLSDCDFFWLIGEDDVFMPDAVSRMHSLIQKVDVPFIFSNYAFIGDDTGVNLGQALDGIPEGLIESSQFIAANLWAAGFLGACVVRQSDWSRTESAPYEGTYYTHVGRISEILSVSPVMYVSAHCNVGNRVEGHDTFTWKKDSYGVFFGFLAMCETVASRRPAIAEAMRAAGLGMERRYRWLSLRVAARLRSEHAFDYGQYRKYLHGLSTHRLKKLAFMSISLLPPALIEPVVRMYRASRPRS